MGSPQRCKECNEYYFVGGTEYCGKYLLPLVHSTQLCMLEMNFKRERIAPSREDE